MRRLLSLLVVLMMSAAMMLAQNKTVTGVVVAQEDGEPIIGATVVIPGTTTGTVTDIDGRFSISVPQNTKTLSVSFVGMTTVEAAVTTGELKVALASDDKVLDDVVVTAMGVRRDRKALGYAVQDLKGDVLTQAANTDLSSALQGKVTGVSITPSSGMPGASSKIVIRGARSFDGNNSPLYVIDGQPVASTPDVDTGNSVTGSDFAGRSVDIDPNDIESINILKGQAASALYGMRASNGVILITTKSGRGTGKGRPQITYSSNFNWDRISVVPDLQKDYAQGSLTKNGYTYNPTASTSWGPKISELANDPTYGGNTDNRYTQQMGRHQGMYYNIKRAEAGQDPWEKPQAYDNVKNFFNTGFQWSNHVSVSQNNERGNINLSLGNTYSTGIVPSTGLNRINAHLGGDTNLNKHWQMGFTGNFVTSKITKQSGANNGIVATLYGAPASYDYNGIPCHAEGDPYTQVNFRGGAFDNAYWACKNNEFAERNQRFYGNMYAKYSTDFGTNKKHQLDVKYQLGEDAYTTNYTEIYGFGAKSDPQGSIKEWHYTKAETNSLFTLNYNWKVNKELNVSALYGNEIVYYTSRMNDMTGKNFNFPGWNHMNNVNTYVGQSEHRKTSTFGNFVNLAADWKSMLFLNVSGRTDRVSNMPNGNRTFFYPSYSLGFVFTELEALKNNVLTYGKLRASYAQVGQAGDYYESYYSTPTYGGGWSSGTPIMYPIGSVTAYTPYTRLYDPNLKPMNINSWEVGTDFGFWGGRMKFEFTFNRQDVKDQIFAVPIAASTGYAEMMTNAGKIHTNSIEMTWGGTPIRTKNWEWTLDFNFTKTDNYVDELADGVESIMLGGFVTPQVRASAGDKFPVIYGKSFLRDEAGRIVVDEDGFPMGGEDAVIGSVSPDFTLGVSTSVTYKKLRLGAVVDFKVGGQMYCGTKGILDFYGTSAKSRDFRDNDFKSEYGTVKEDGTPNDIIISKDDAFYYFNNLTDIDESSIYGTGFIKLRELSLSYPLIDRKALKLNLNVFARNLLLWTEVEGFDPEASQGNNNMGGGFERFSLPGASSYGFGLTFNF